VRLVHEAGGLASYDQANANGILGITRAGDAGFDLCHFNLHKTFSTPHGSGGPGCGAIGVRQELARFLPVPVVEFEDGRYRLNYDLPHSIGKIKQFYGNVQNVLRAYAWAMSLGADGLRQVAETSVLNNNYVLSRMRRIRGASAPYAPGKHRIEQVRYSWDDLHRETGVTTEDLGLRAADYGLHYWTSHHPFVVPQPLTIEPTESYSRADLDEYVDVLEHVAQEAYTDPERVKTAPHNSTVHRGDPEPFDDPSRWAMTWRAYKRKVQMSPEPGAAAPEAARPRLGRRR
jgi:glycine dehydrogenase subunit 2